VEKSTTPTQSPANEITSEKFILSIEQIDALSLRLMPEIKKFFTDTRTQKEFEKWKGKQQENKS
jgi:hypothetical protein